MMSPHPAKRWASLRRAALLYAAVLLAGSALFFALHYAGNTIPYDVALEKIVEEYESDQPNLGYLASMVRTQEYCQRASAVLGGAKRLDGDSALVDAVVLRIIATEESVGYCETLPLLPGNDNVHKGLLKFRYWWGTNSFYAIALRFLSDADIREWTRLLTIFAWGSLAFMLWLLSRKAFLAVAPLAVFASFFSGLQYFSDAGTGMPFLWTPIFAAGLAFAMSRPGLAKTARLCCFVIGMGSSYLWLLDGHNVLVIALIGLITYFGAGEASAVRRIRESIFRIALYVAGFALCFGVGLLVKDAFLQWIADFQWNSASNPSESFFTQFTVHWESLIETLSQAFANGWAEAPIIRDFTPYWIMGPDRVAFGQAVTLLSILAFAVASAFAVGLSFRRANSLLADISLVILLATVVCAQFVIPEDIPYRSSRYLFVLHALCWSCFLLAAREAYDQWRRTTSAVEGGGGSARAAGNRRARRDASRLRPSNSPASLRLRFTKNASPGAFLALSAIALAAGVGFGSALLRSDAAFVRETIQETQPWIYGLFNVYYAENKLVYERADCDEYDTAPLFFLHLLPANPEDLPSERHGYAFDNLHFYFAERKVPYSDGCAAVVNLPDYEITAVSTGQYIRGERQLWQGEFRPDQPPKVNVAEMTALLNDAELLAQSEFNVQLKENTLLLTRLSCDSEDILPRFFFHVAPSNVDDLPEERKQHGFDNLDFNFLDYGALLFQEGMCVAARELPGYPVTAVSVGQYTNEGPVWGLTIDLTRRRPPPIDVASATALLNGAELLAQSEFDIHRNGNTLLWTKSPCANEDVLSRFFLHVIPVSQADLPEERRVHGFDNLDFNFLDHGALLLQERRCIATRELPGYPAASIRTGQYVRGEGEIWSEAIDLR